MHRCVPQDISSLINIAREKNIDLVKELKINPIDIPLLPKAVQNIEFLAEFEAVSFNTIQHIATCIFFSHRAHDAIDFSIIIEWS